MSVEKRNFYRNKEQASTSLLAAVGLFALDFFKVFILAVAIIIPVRWFLFQPFVVTGDSMRPNFENGNYLIIDEISYRLREPQRGEVVVLRFPNDPSQFFIKRIIGLPGERVVIEEGKVQIYQRDELESFVLQEEYLPQNHLTYGNLDRKLAGEEYFVLGDNRLSSSDSRVWGALKRKNIVGRAYIRVFPMKDFEIFSPPSFPVFVKP